MPTWNLTLIANNTGIPGMMTAVNDQLMFGWYGPMILIALTVIAFLGAMFVSNSAKSSAAFATFFAFGTSIFFASFGLVNDIVIYSAVIASAVSAGFLYFTSSR